MMVLGLLLTAIGLDHLDGVPRLTFGNTTLAGGLSFTSLAIGLFGVSEILVNLEKTELIKSDPAEIQGSDSPHEGCA